ncbi:hypothetical protein ACFV2U_45270 [Streptomyces sp. NPDC059697]
MNKKSRSATNGTQPAHSFADWRRYAISFRRSLMNAEAAPDRIALPGDTQ